LDLSVAQLVAFTRGGCGATGANAATAQQLRLKNKDGAEKPRRESLRPLFLVDVGTIPAQSGSQNLLFMPKTRHLNLTHINVQMTNALLHQVFHVQG